MKIEIELARGRRFWFLSIAPRIVRGLCISGGPNRRGGRVIARAIAGGIRGIS